MNDLDARVVNLYMEHAGPDNTTAADTMGSERGAGADLALPAAEEARPARGRVALAAAAVVVIIGLVAGSAVVAMGPSEPVDERLLVRSDDGAISLIDPETGEIAYTLPGALATPDRSALLTTRPSADGTVVESRDPSTGLVTGSTQATGDLTVRTISPRGTAVVLMPGEPGPGLYEPMPRRETDLTVAFLDDRPQLSFTLDGNIEPEMFSLDESTLFVLQFVPPEAPTSYHVMKLDLATGELSETAPIQVDLNPAMRGKARAQVLDPDGRYLHTLYTLPSDDPVFEGADQDATSERWAFVHVISLDEQWSACIFLPTPFGTQDEGTVGMTVSADGSTIYVADPTVSSVAVIDVDSLNVTEVHEVPLLRPTGERAVLAAAPDGTLYVAAGAIVLELAPGTFEAVFAWSRPSNFTGLAVAGDELRMAAEGEVVLVDRHTRYETGVIASPTHGRLDLLGPPRGSVTEFPLQCAC